MSSSDSFKWIIKRLKWEQVPIHRNGLNGWTFSKDGSGCKEQIVKEARLKAGMAVKRLAQMPQWEGHSAYSPNLHPLHPFRIPGVLVRHETSSANLRASHTRSSYLSGNARIAYIKIQDTNKSVRDYNWKRENMSIVHVLLRSFLTNKIKSPSPFTTSETQATGHFSSFLQRALSVQPTLADSDFKTRQERKPSQHALYSKEFFLPVAPNTAITFLLVVLLDKEIV